MVDAIVAAMVGSVVAVIAFVVVKQIVATIPQGLSPTFKPHMVQFRQLAKELGISKEQLERELGVEIVIVKNSDYPKQEDGSKVYLDNSYCWFITDNKDKVFSLVGVHKKADSVVRCKLREVPKL